MTARRVLALAVAALVGVTGFATTATNVVADSFIDRGGSAVTPNQLAPSQCAALDLDDIRPPSGGGGKGGAALTLGTAGDDRIVAGGHDDCILGGGGDDSINAGGGFDICLGGPGNDSFKNCDVVFQ